MGVGGIRRGTYGVTAGLGCRPLLNRRPAAFFWVGRSRSLHALGRCRDLGMSMWGKEHPSLQAQQSSRGVEGEDRMWALGHRGLCLSPCPDGSINRFAGRTPHLLGDPRAQLYARLLAPDSRFKVHI